EPGDLRRPAGRDEQGRQDLDEGRLAGPVGTEQAEVLPGFDVEVDAAQGGHRLGLRLVDAGDPAGVNGKIVRHGEAATGSEAVGGRDGMLAPTAAPRDTSDDVADRSPTQLRGRTRA